MMENLTRDEFDVLVALCELDEIAGCTNGLRTTREMNPSANSVLIHLIDKKLVFNDRLTDRGIQALEPYRVRRAIFMAAGFGSRLAPITLNTPKPLVRVHGTRIIDTLIDACLAAGIDEIVIVCGYLAEQFETLKAKYPMVRLVDNPLYNEANNISSALAAGDLLKNAYIFEADLLLSNPSIIRRYHYTSEFLAIPVERSDDWCFVVEDGRIVKQMVGGEHCYQMVGISYWDEKDGASLAEDIPEAFCAPGGKELYWEQVPLKIYKDKYRVGIQECTAEDIVEIDTFRELKAIDTAYDV